MDGCLELSQAFIAHEGYLRAFVDEEHAELKTPCSVELLCEEELKHIARFVPVLSTREMPSFEDLVTHPAFRRTRHAAPGLETLAKSRPARHQGLYSGPELSVAADAPRTLVQALDDAITADSTVGITYIHSSASRSCWPQVDSAR
jgi:hypothetical protein